LEIEAFADGGLRRVTIVTLVMREDFPPFLSDENGHLSMADDAQNWLVIVTREALEDVSEPADDSLECLIQNQQLFCDVATFKLEHGRAGDDDTIWIQTDDLKEWRSLQSR
jgi:hypothetical protein